MKKKYIKPEIQVVEVELQSMLAASDMGVFPDETPVESGLSKGYDKFDVWGLDEE